MHGRRIGLFAAILQTPESFSNLFWSLRGGDQEFESPRFHSRYIEASLSYDGGELSLDLLREVDPFTTMTTAGR
jgi:hypothetical protein